MTTFKHGRVSMTVIDTSNIRIKVARTANTTCHLASWTIWSIAARSCGATNWRFP